MGGLVFSNDFSLDVLGEAGEGVCVHAFGTDEACWKRWVGGWVGWVKEENDWVGLGGLGRGEGGGLNELL